MRKNLVNSIMVAMVCAIGFVGEANAQIGVPITPVQTFTASGAAHIPAAPTLAAPTLGARALTFAGGGSNPGAVLEACRTDGLPDKSVLAYNLLAGSNWIVNSASVTASFAAADLVANLLFSGGVACQDAASAGIDSLQQGCEGCFCSPQRRCGGGR